MEIKTMKLYYGGKQMPWGKGAIIKNFKGLVILADMKALYRRQRPKIRHTSLISLLKWLMEQKPRPD